MSVKTNSLIFIFSTIMSSPDKSYIPESNTSWGNSLVVIESSDLVNLYKAEVRS